MKTPEQVDNIMATIPPLWRRRWCGGEQGPCACLGCVQIGNRLIMAEKIRGRPYYGDPEYINEARLQEYKSVYADLKITKGEWESWMQRQKGA